MMTKVNFRQMFVVQRPSEMFHSTKEPTNNRPWKLKDVRNRRLLLEFRFLKALFTFPSDVFSTKLLTVSSATSGLEKFTLRMKEASEKSFVP